MELGTTIAFAYQIIEKGLSLDKLAPYRLYLRNSGIFPVFIM